MNSNDPLLHVAAAVADGTPVDWDTAGRSVVSADERQVLRELQFIADLTGTQPASGDSGSGVPGETPRMWGPFQIIERVGGGAFGNVFRAWDTRLDRVVALKLLRPERSTSTERASTIVHEGRLLARVRHPNVVTVYGAESIDGRVGIWMEFIPGHTLEEELQRHGPIDAERASEIGAALGAALEAVHRAGLVHRDIKAQNVIRGTDGRLMLADFGAGCDDLHADRVRRGLAGTPLYLAPEVFEGHPATAASDIYGLGVLLFHLVTDSYPVQGRTFEEIQEAHRRGDRSPLGRARPDLPQPFVRVIERALDSNPARRVQSAEEFRIALSAASGRSSRRWLAAAFACSLLAAIGLALVSLRTQAETPNPAAYQLYLEARGLADGHGATRDVRRAASLFEQAIAADPGFAAAYAGFAQAWALLSINYGGAAPEEALARLEPAAQKALELDPRLPDAHAAMGVALARKRRWQASDAAFQRALKLDRTHAPTYVAYAIAALFPQGKVAEASAMLSTALEFDARSNEIRRNLAWVQVSAGAYDAAIANCQHVLGEAPDDIHVQQVWARALLHQGKIEQAIAMLEKHGPPSRGFLGYAYAVAGRREEAEAMAWREHAFPARQALIWAGLDRKDEAFDALDRMVANGEPRAGIYLTHPELANLRADPRVAVLRARLGLR